MNKKRTILVPIDFCPAAEAAVKYCLEHEYNDETRIILIHTYRLITEDTSHYSDSPFALKTSIEKQLKLKFKALSNKLHLDDFPKVEFLLEVGFLVNYINTMCKESDIDLIVYGLKEGGTNQSLIELISSGYAKVLIIDQHIEAKENPEKLTLAQKEFIQQAQTYISESHDANSVLLVEP